MTPKVAAKVSWKDSAPGGAIISGPSGAADARGCAPDSVEAPVDAATEPGGAYGGSPESPSDTSRLQKGPGGGGSPEEARTMVTGTPVAPHSCAKTVYGTPRSDFSVLDNASFSSSPSTPSAMSEQGTPTSHSPVFGSITPTTCASGVPPHSLPTVSPHSRASMEAARSPVSPDGIPGGPKALNLSSPAASESATAEGNCCVGQGSRDELGRGGGGSSGRGFGREADVDVLVDFSGQMLLSSEGDACGERDKEAAEFFKALQGSFRSPSPSGASTSAAAGSVLARGVWKSGDKIAASPLEQVSFL
jgi:hypothetical protein